MRSLILLLVGLIVGALGTAILINSLNRGTAYPQGVMAVLGAQIGALDQSIKQNRCAPTDIIPRLQTLRYVANDIEPAFADRISDAQFGRYAGELRAAADAALMSPPGNCPSAAAMLSKLKQSCDSCHRDFRG